MSTDNQRKPREFWIKSTFDGVAYTTVASLMPCEGWTHVREVLGHAPRAPDESLVNIKQAAEEVATWPKWKIENMKAYFSESMPDQKNAGLSLVSEEIEAAAFETGYRAAVHAPDYEKGYKVGAHTFLSRGRDIGRVEGWAECIAFLETDPGQGSTLLTDELIDEAKRRGIKTGYKI